MRSTDFNEALALRVGREVAALEYSEGGCASAYFDSVLAGERDDQASVTLAIRAARAAVLATFDELTTKSVEKSANILMHRCHAASAQAGWWIGADPLIDHNVVPTKLMLIVSEVAEAMEGHRKGLQDDKLPHRPMIEVELADAMIRIADLAGALALDLGGAIAEKMAFNATREDHKAEVRKLAGGKAY